MVRMIRMVRSLADRTFQLCSGPNRRSVLVEVGPTLRSVFFQFELLDFVALLLCSLDGLLWEEGPEQYISNPGILIVRRKALGTKFGGLVLGCIVAELCK